MELVYDWKGYHSLFHQKRRATGDSHPIHLIVDRGLILAIFCESEDLSTWIGSPEKELTQTLAHRKQYRFELPQVEEWLKGARDCTHFPEEIKFLKQKAQAHYPDPTKKQFLLSATQGWWNKLIPATYGVYIRINDGRSLLLTIQRKKLMSFQIPDLSGLSTDRQKQFPEIVKLLSERYLIPVQGFSLTKEEWNTWCSSANPWPLILQTLRTNREKVYPFKWGLMGLIGLRAYFHF